MVLVVGGNGERVGAVVVRRVVIDGAVMFASVALIWFCVPVSSTSLVLFPVILRPLRPPPTPVLMVIVPFVTLQPDRYV